MTAAVAAFSLTNPAATVPTPADETRADVFALKATDMDLFEVEAARLVATRSTNVQVKAFAKKMDTAHTKSTAGLTAAMIVTTIAMASIAVLSALDALDPDALTPREALAMLYELKILGKGKA